MVCGIAPDGHTTVSFHITADFVDRLFLDVHYKPHTNILKTVSMMFITKPKYEKSITELCTYPFGTQYKVKKANTLFIAFKLRSNLQSS